MFAKKIDQNKLQIVKKPALKAFTLSEVLITLGIIGVIAAMTIPTLIANYQKTQYVTQLKKAYSQMNQVLQQMAIDNGTIGDISSYFGTTTQAGEAIASHYKVIKNCGMETGQGCFATFNINYDGTGSSTSDVDNSTNFFKFITADGMTFTVYSYNSDCSTTRGINVTNSPLYANTCGSVYIDVNGTKKPNYLGRDVFLFFVPNKTPILYPDGGFYRASTADAGNAETGGETYWNYNNRNYCGSNSNKNGSYCAGRIMEKGWVMDY